MLLLFAGCPPGAISSYRLGRVDAIALVADAIVKDGQWSLRKVLAPTAIPVAARVELR